MCGWSGIGNRSLRCAVSEMVSQKVSILFPHLMARDSKGKLGYSESI